MRSAKQHFFLSCSRFNKTNVNSTNATSELRQSFHRAGWQKKAMLASLAGFDIQCHLQAHRCVSL